MSVASFAMSRTSQRSRTPSVVTSNRFTLSGKKNLKKSTQAKIPRSAASAFFSTDQLKSMSARPISVTTILSSSRQTARVASTTFRSTTSICSRLSRLY